MIEYKTVHSTSEHGLSDNELNKLGAKRWELINVIRARLKSKEGYEMADVFMFFFKRNKQ